jgi:hypothetical protein
VFVTEDGDVGYREWAPGAKGVSLVNKYIILLILVW